MERKDKRGFLSIKKGTGLGAWKNRFFVVEEGRLQIYKDNSMSAREVDLDLLECAGGGVNIKSNQYPRKQLQDYAFSFESKDGTEFLVCAENAEEKMAWVEALSENIQIARRRHENIVPSGPINSVKTKIVAKPAVVGTTSIVEKAAAATAATADDGQGEAKDLKVQLEKERSTVASLKQENEALKKEVAAAKTTEASLRKELDLAKKLYKEAKEQKPLTASDGDWISEMDGPSSTDGNDVGLMKKQLGVMAKKAGRMRKEIEDLQDENEVLRETVQDLQSQLAAQKGATTTQQTALDLDLEDQLAELEQMLEETAQRQAKYERFYKMWKELKDKYEPDDDDDLPPNLGPQREVGDSDRLSGSYLSMRVLAENQANSDF